MPLVKSPHHFPHPTAHLSLVWVASETVHPRPGAFLGAGNMTPLQQVRPRGLNTMGENVGKRKEFRRMERMRGRRKTDRREEEDKQQWKERRE